MKTRSFYQIVEADSLKPNGKWRLVVWEERFESPEAQPVLTISHVWESEDLQELHRLKKENLPDVPRWTVIKRKFVVKKVVTQTKSIEVEACDTDQAHYVADRRENDGLWKNSRREYTDIEEIFEDDDRIDDA